MQEKPFPYNSIIKFSDLLRLKRLKAGIWRSGTMDSCFIGNDMKNLIIEHKQTERNLRPDFPDHSAICFFAWASDIFLLSNNLK